MTKKNKSGCQKTWGSNVDQVRTFLYLEVLRGGLLVSRSLVLACVARVILSPHIPELFPLNNYASYVTRWGILLGLYKHSSVLWHRVTHSLALFAGIWRNTSMSAHNVSAVVQTKKKWWICAKLHLGLWFLFPSACFVHYVYLHFVLLFTKWCSTLGTWQRVCRIKYTKFILSRRLHERNIVPPCNRSFSQTAPCCRPPECALNARWQRRLTKCAWAVDLAAPPPPSLMSKEEDESVAE